jgi:hypothetical protein
MNHLVLSVNSRIGSTGNPKSKVFIVFAKDYLEALY